MASHYSTDEVVGFLTGERPFPVYSTSSNSEVESNTECDDKTSSSRSLDGAFDLEEASQPGSKLPRLEVCSSESELEVMECEIVESKAQSTCNTSFSDESSESSVQFTSKSDTSGSESSASKSDTSGSESSASKSDTSGSESSAYSEEDTASPIPRRGRYSNRRGRSVQGRGRGRGFGGRRANKKCTSNLPKGAINITVRDSAFVYPISNSFCPIREPGPHIPDDTEIDPLSLFELYFDNTVVERILESTLAYADHKKSEMNVSYSKFMLLSFTKAKLFSYLGALILLGLHGVRNHRYTWSTKTAQTLVRLSELLPCEQYELISTFLHLVTPSEELQLGNKLCKILPLHKYLKAKCLELYQPFRELSVDERMVKSKARTHFRQYIRNKPTKWGFKYWVIADTTGYTVDFEVYSGKAEIYSDKGLSYDVVINLVQPFMFQGYEVYFDNFYTSPILLQKLLENEIVATGTLNLNRKNIPSEVHQMKKYVQKLPRVTGYYYRQKKSSITYCVWKDTKTVVLASTAYPAHSENDVARRVKDPVTKSSITTNVPCPLMLEKYNRSMGGVDKSDQYISYHKVRRKTVKYWKTMFYHLIDVSVVNAHILYNWLQLQNSGKPMTENTFRDTLVLKIIATYGTKTISQTSTSTSNTRSYNVRHGSKLYPVSQRSRCIYCHLHNASSFTQRKCPDCPLTPALCQTLEKDCHSVWHSKSFAVIRNLWYRHRLEPTVKMRDVQTTNCGRGRPKGSINRRRRRGAYRSK